jgi:hypothetical protein
MRYCKVKTTGQVIETQSGGGDLEMFYGNNSAYSRDELEVGIADDEVVRGWLSEQVEQAKTYVDKRKSEYPTIEECVHAILDGELDDLQIKRQAVKDKYPKGDN